MYIFRCTNNYVTFIKGCRNLIPWTVWTNVPSLSSNIRRSLSVLFICSFKWRTSTNPWQLPASWLPPIDSSRKIAFIPSMTWAAKSCKHSGFKSTLFSVMDTYIHYFRHKVKHFFLRNVHRRGNSHLYKYKKHFSQNVEGCRDGSAKNHRN